MTARVSMLLKSRVSPDMLPFFLCNKKILAIRHKNRHDTIDSVLRHREVGRAKDLSAPPRNDTKYSNHNIITDFGTVLINLRRLPLVTGCLPYCCVTFTFIWPKSHFPQKFGLSGHERKEYTEKSVLIKMFGTKTGGKQRKAEEISYFILHLKLLG